MSISWDTALRSISGENVSSFFIRSGMRLDGIARMIVDWMVPEEGGWVICLDTTYREQK
ncbi:hypothetical protein [Endozoicomonas sp. ONNA1]|uniref:hypothetical protein n=1 Tax=Endozoicomonas sp. ONNA1 TaxID=2828740 RepID=UPI0021482FC7|nr:hypothetical protein [Endozoicomonas sp. ONNA1]